MEKNELLATIAEHEEQSLERFNAIRELLETARDYLLEVHAVDVEVIERDGWTFLEFYLRYGDYAIDGKINTYDCHIDFDLWDDGVYIDYDSQHLAYGYSKPPVHYFLIEALCALVRALDAIDLPGHDKFDEILDFSRDKTEDE